MMVVYAHTQDQVMKFPIHADLPAEYSGAGVDIFFVISGFIMWTNTYAARQTPFEFMSRRIERIVPLYWAITFFVAAIAIVSPNLLSSTRFEAYHFLASLFFIPAQHPVVPYIYPFVIPGWTLNYEMFFYLLFAVSLLLAPNSRIVVSVSVLIVLAALSPFVPAGQTILTFYTDPIVCEFALGLLVGAVFTAKVNVRPSVAWSALIVGFLLIVAADALFDLREVQRSLKWGIPAGLIVFGSVMLERERSIPSSRLLLAIGNASYSIYLTHFMTLALLARLWRARGTPMLGFDMVLFTIVSFMASAAVGYAVYRLVERPTQQYFATRRKRARA